MASSSLCSGSKELCASFSRVLDFVDGISGDDVICDDANDEFVAPGETDRYDGSLSAR